jgi:HD-GYP domain-containing protein (c-di-GMP phosphodiesterase class II)
VRAPSIACGPILLDLSVSVGAARASSTLSLDHLIDSADRALYVAKARGRDQVCLSADGGTGTVAEFPQRDEEDTEQLRTAWAVAHATSVGQRDRHDHLTVVADLCAAVATRLELDDAAVLRSRLGGLLHDVGKVGVPDAILDKPGPLTPAEWTIMRGHCAHGESIVLGFDNLRDLAPIVRHHHERFGGGGYPDGLVGEAIPLEARIIAATDTYSAIVAHRSYRPARTPDEAFAELRKASGTQLDPRVVDALLQQLNAAPVTHAQLQAA